MTRTVAIINASTLVTDAEVAKAADAIQRQVDEDAGPAWGFAATLVARVSNAIAGEWPVRLVDVCDVDEALGYHDDDKVPSGIVGIKSALDDGVPWSSVLSHEVLELLGDPICNLAAETDGIFYGLELCDACEGYRYVIDDIQVSDFVLPPYFVKGSTGPWDHLGLLQGPLTLGTNGYTSKFSGGTWSQVNAEHVHASRRVPHPLSRRGRRFKGVIAPGKLRIGNCNALLRDALDRQRRPCDHQGIGLPGCVVCDPRMPRDRD